MRTSRFALAIGVCLLATTACTGGEPAAIPSSVSPTVAVSSSDGTPPALDAGALSLEAGALLPGTAAGPPAAPASVVGTWGGSYRSAKYTTTGGTFTVTLAQTGADLAGTIAVAAGCVDRGTVTGLLDGTRVTFGAINGGETLIFDGVLVDGTMSGNYQSGPGCGTDLGTWTATRR